MSENGVPWHLHYSAFANIKEPEDLEEYLALQDDDYKVIKFYEEHGSWRQVARLTSEEEATIERLVANRDERKCYYNAMTAATPGSLTYVEGYALTGDVAVPHAWVEIEKKVVDITRNMDAKWYYGVEFEFDTVAEMMLECGTAMPIAEWMVDGCKRGV